jgi:glucokinase
MKDPNGAVLCIDIGGTSTKAGIFEPWGELKPLGSIPSRGPAASFAGALETLMTEAAAAADGPVIGLGVAVAGFLDEARDRMIYNSNLPWLEDFPLRARLAQHFDGPIELEVDSNAAALAEYYRGAGQGSSRFLCLTVGTGLGVGMIVHGHPLRFAYGCMGDPGHVIVQPNGPLCTCGGHGCAEILVSAPRLAEEYRRAKGIAEECSLRDVIEAARGGDKAAIPVLEHAGEWLGIATASLANTFYPDRIAFAGGLAEAGDLVMHSVERAFDYAAGTFTKKNVQLERARLGALSTLTGAAYAVLTNRED